MFFDISVKPFMEDERHSAARGRGGGNETTPLIVDVDESIDENSGAEETGPIQIPEAPPDNYYLVFSKIKFYFMFGRSYESILLCF